MSKTRKMATTGGVIAVIGILIGMLLNLPGGNDGVVEEQGADSTIPENISVSVDSSGSDAASQPTETQPGDDRQVEPEVDGAISAQVLYVLIDGRSYAYATQPETQWADYKTVELDELVSLAKMTVGDSNRIRVRISRTKAARVSAQETLLDKLEATGLANDAVLVVDQLVEP